jgi:hypothetical protein
LRKTTRKKQNKKNSASGIFAESKKIASRKDTAWEFERIAFNTSGSGSCGELHSISNAVVLTIERTAANVMPISTSRPTRGSLKRPTRTRFHEISVCGQRCLAKGSTARYRIPEIALQYRDSPIALR